jgi:homopolymeric O-antigen transport system permease protein
MSIGRHNRTYTRISASGGLGVAIGDVLETLKVQGLAWHLAMRDIRLRYRRTVIGPFWTVLSVSIFVAALGIVSALIFGQDVPTFLPRFAAAYFVWVTIVAFVLESAVAFTGAEQVIRSMRSPLTLHIERVIIRNTIVFAHLLLVFIPLAIVLQVPVNFAAAGWWLFGVGLLIVNGFWIGLLTAIINTRFRDFYQLVATALQILFFLVPIFWDPEALRAVPIAHAIMVEYNPFFMQIEVIRLPMVGEAIVLNNYILLTIVGAVGTLISILALGAAKRRIGVWL